MLTLSRLTIRMHAQAHTRGPIAPTLGEVSEHVLQLTDVYGSPSLEDIKDVARKVSATLEEALGEEASGEIEVSISTPVRPSPGNPQHWQVHCCHWICSLVALHREARIAWVTRRQKAQ
jgi:hypothetical protein